MEPTDGDGNREAGMTTRQSLDPLLAPEAGWAVHRYRHAPVTRVAPCGEVDRDLAPSLHRCLSAAIAQRTDVLLDLSDVTLLDCAGVRTILTAHDTAALAGHTVTLLAPQPLVRYVLRVTGASTVVPVIGASVTDADSDRLAGRI
jgi:anti-sigma B factor antagonist